MTYPQMDFIRIVPGQVPPQLEDQVSVSASSISITKGSYLKGPAALGAPATRTVNLTAMAYYAGVYDQPIEHPQWTSSPDLHCQGELLGICAEPWPAYDCIVWEWTSVQCRLEMSQTVQVYGNGIKRYGPHVEEAVLLRTYPMLAKREYPPQTLEAHSMSFPTELENWIVSAIEIKIQVKLKGEYSYLYFSSRCDSPQFSIDLPSSYRLGWAWEA
jgi:hypothetical protein